MTYDIVWCQDTAWGHAAGWNEQQYYVDLCQRVAREWCAKHDNGQGYNYELRLKCSEFGRPRQSGSDVRKVQKATFSEIKTCVYSANDPVENSKCNKDLQQTRLSVWSNLNIKCSPTQVKLEGAGNNPTVVLTMTCEGEAPIERIEEYYFLGTNVSEDLTQGAEHLMCLPQGD